MNEICSNEILSDSVKNPSSCLSQTQMKKARVRAVRSAANSRSFSLFMRN